MTVETELVPQPEYEILPPPTTLHLFRFSEHQLPTVQPMVESTTRLHGVITLVRRSNERLTEELNARVKRIVATSNDLIAQENDMKSSCAASTAYLKLSDELSQRGAQSQQTMDFFSLCLALNTRISNRISSGETKAYGPLKIFVDKGAAIQLFKEDVHRMAGEPPSWFGNNLNAWRIFVGERASFAAYLNSDLIAKYGASIPPKLLVGRLGTTRSNALPDWLTEEGDQLPNRSTVEEELEEDTKEVDVIKNEHERTKRHALFIKDYVEQKMERVVKWSLAKIVELFPEDLSFYQLLLFLKLTYGYPVVKGDDLSKIKADDLSNIYVRELVREINTRAISPDSIRVEAIKEYMVHEGETAIEPLALWIEDCLKRSGLITNAQEVIDVDRAEILDSLFTEAGNLSGAIGDRWINLRAENPHTFSPLNYDLKPFISLLSKAELSYLQEILQAFQGSTLESLIWEMANLVAGNTSGISEFAASDKTLGKAYLNFKNFSMKWLRRNWQWAYDQLLMSLSGQIPEISIIPQEEPTTLVVPELKEVETAIDEVSRGDLANWNIFYTERMLPGTDSAERIAGTTIEERERALNDFLLARSISCSIGPDSVIRALEWLTSVPQEIEQIRKRKKIAGVDFKKLERGAVRIFYRMDQAKKELVFFVHQKKSWKYGF